MKKAYREKEHGGCGGGCGSAAKESSAVLTCTACEAANIPGRRFCRSCGAGLGKACPDCCFFNEISDNYCGGCGGRLNEESVERKTAAQEERWEAQPETKRAPRAQAVDFRELFRKRPDEKASVEETVNEQVSQDELDSLFDQENLVEELEKKAV